MIIQPPPNPQPPDTPLDHAIDVQMASLNMKVKVTSRISILRAFTFLSISGDDEIDIDEYTTVWNQSYGIPVEECREAFHKISDVSRLPLDDFFFKVFAIYKVYLRRKSLFSPIGIAKIEKTRGCKNFVQSRFILFVPCINWLGWLNSGMSQFPLCRTQL